MNTGLVKTAINDAFTKNRQPKVRLADMGYKTLGEALKDYRAILKAHKEVLGEEVASFRTNQADTAGLRKARYARADAIRKFMRPPDKVRVDMLGNYTDELFDANGKLKPDVVHVQDPYLGARKVHAIRSLLMRENKTHNKLMHDVKIDGRKYVKRTDTGLDAYLDKQEKLMDNVNGLKKSYYFGDRKIMPFYLGKDIKDFMSASAHGRQGSSFVIPDKLIEKDYEYNVPNMYLKAYNGNDSADPRKFSTRKGFIDTLSAYIIPPKNGIGPRTLRGSYDIVVKNKTGIKTRHDGSGNLKKVKGSLDYIKDAKSNTQNYTSYGFDYAPWAKRDLDPYGKDATAPDRKWTRRNVLPDRFHPWMDENYNERNFNPYRNY